MPIWKVSLTDGTFQVADADGALYPLTSKGEPLTRFNEGWSPRGLQTGLPPFHVLELEHVDGERTIWLHDETLDYRANAVLGLSLDDQNRFFAVLDPVVRTLYAECVLAPQAAIPSAAHQFDGMLPRTVELLIADSIRRTMPGTDTVVLDRLQELQAGYGNGPDALSADWIARAIDAPSDTAQERFDLPGRRCDRHVDADTGLVYYVTRTEDPSETALFVPQHKVVLVRSRHTHDPLALLLGYYASHTDRAVVLPEALDLSPEMVVPPPQHGLDEPPVLDERQVEEPVAATGYVDQPAHEPVLEDVHVHDHDQGRTVFEAPLSETPAGQYASGHETVAELELPHDRSQAGHATDSWRQDEIDQQEELPPVIRAAPSSTMPYSASPPPPPPAPKQNWWQRLLGLGNP